MLPAAFLNAIGVGLEWIEGLASKAGTLRQLLGIARTAETAQGAFFKFAALMRKGTPGMSYQDISPVYRAARYFTDLPKYLSTLDKDVIIDRTLASVVPTASGLGPKGEPVRYGVKVYVTFPADGVTQVFDVWVESNEYRSWSDVVERGIEAIMANFEQGSRFQDYGGDAPNGVVRGEITRFEKFTHARVA